MSRHFLQRVVAGLAFGAASPIVGAAAIVIKRQSPGPVFFKSKRVGLRGSQFTILKLRTMHVQAPGGAAITTRDDPRVFAAGTFLRRFKIDELPQLLNIARGEMAFVGPRPEDPRIVEQDYRPYMMESLEVLPGLTSPGSLDYYRMEAELPSDARDVAQLYASQLLPRKVAIDIAYLRQQTIRYDLEIVVRTLLDIVGVRNVFAKRREQEIGLAEKILRDAGQGQECA